MLLREGATGLEVFVMHRVASMAFAPSVTVFPGGGVDPTDQWPPDWSGPDRTWWARALGKEPAEASALVVAAARELFEETGVLLSDGAPGEQARLVVAEHRGSLREVMVAHGLKLRSELLRPWANWITPPGNTRRYDTFFFLAALPEGQQAQMLTTEAESGRWARPADLLAEHETGRLAMMPPTLAMLMDLQQAGTVQWAMGQSRTLEPQTPVIRSRPGEPLEVEAAGRTYRLRRQGQ
jgi:8-oxo-dGTP pyrophosphatase MutT (NUDIX family)